ncbi:hypothetical protein C8R45DRAFT_1136777 [Mycena sanguinolenta]|nr:hypothetical protein C8R45DRAFT_1136777 [Mycena sanguinolenta]
MESNVLDNLTYLSKYLDESTARVRELENELANTRSASSAKSEMNSRILKLESENANLCGQVSCLQDQLKVKHERLDTMSAAKQENDEIVLREAKYTELQAQLKDTAELAAKALRERIEAAKILETSRQEYAQLQGAHNALVADGLASEEHHAVAYARLKAKYDKVKDEKTSLRECCAEKDAQIQSSTDKLSRLRGKYQAVKDEGEQLKGTLREMIELVEQNDRHQMVNQLSKQNKEADDIRAQLQEKCVLLESRIAELEEGLVSEIAKAGEKYRQYMNDLPKPEKLPPFATTLQAVCDSDTNLHGYLSQRVEALSGHNYLAYGPTACYDRSTDTWTEGSDLLGFHGGTRELFVKMQEFVLYVGTYKCHDLRYLHPAATNIPSSISRNEIMHAALGVPLPQHHGQLIEERYPHGKIQVEATGLQCVGFNKELYDIMRKRYSSKRKRKASGGEDLKNGGKRKR